MTIPIPSTSTSRSSLEVKSIPAITEPLKQQLLDQGFPLRVKEYPQIRFMGSKFRLLPWLHSVLQDFPFDSVADVFAGSGCVSYLFKAMGKRVVCSDFLNLGATIGKALIENPFQRLSQNSLKVLLENDCGRECFIENTFTGIFFTPDDLRFLDQVCWNLRKLDNPIEQSIARAALIRSCAKRQPRGVFTIAGDPERYKDGRRDLKLSLREHFLEQVAVYNEATFDNGRDNHSCCIDVFDFKSPFPVDLVYMDPPYVPRADDNCYMKRYHFLEGLSCYWEGKTIMPNTRVKKIEKPYTPFSYRKSAVDAFDQMFRKFAGSILVLSYSSNGFPDLAVLRQLMRKYKPHIEVYERSHRYHFGTHRAVKRSQVKEYLLVGH